MGRGYSPALVPLVLELDERTVQLEERGVVLSEPTTQQAAQLDDPFGRGT